MLRIAPHVLKKDFDSLKNEAFAEYRQTLEGIDNPELFLLQAHLYLEQFFERIICALLPNGEEIMEDAHWSFHQKLLLVHSIGLLPKRTVVALKQLNTLRNRLAHRLRYTANIEDVRKICANLPEHQGLPDQYPDEPLRALELLTMGLLGEVGCWTFIFENAEVVADKAGDANG